MFTSAELPLYWERLDEFEGPGYQRVADTVQCGEGAVPAYIYVLAGSDPTASKRRRIP